MEYVPFYRGESSFCEERGTCIWIRFEKMTNVKNWLNIFPVDVYYRKLAFVPPSYRKSFSSYFWNILQCGNNSPRRSHFTYAFKSSSIGNIREILKTWAKNRLKIEQLVPFWRLCQVSPTSLLRISP